MINLGVILVDLFRLLEFFYGYDKKSTEPSLKVQLNSRPESLLEARNSHIFVSDFKEATLEATIEQFNSKHKTLLRVLRRVNKAIAKCSAKK